MPGRKRANPRRVDADSPAKKRELFQFVPSSRMLTTAACADSACLPHDCATVVQPLAEISNTANDAGEAHNPGKLQRVLKAVRISKSSCVLDTGANSHSR